MSMGPKKNAKFANTKPTEIANPKRSTNDATLIDGLEEDDEITKRSSNIAGNVEPIIKRCFEENFRTFLESSDDLEVFVSKLSLSLSKAIQDHLSKKLNDLDVSVRCLERQNFDLAEKLTEMEEKLENSENYSRRTCLRIYGLQVSNINCDERVLNLFNEKMKLNIKMDAISRSHPLPSRRQDGKSVVIVKFTNYNARAAVFNNKKRLKSSGIVITEDMTTKRYILYQKCRAHFGSENVWSRDTVIKIKEPSGLIYNVRTEKDLSNLITDKELV